MDAVLTINDFGKLLQSEQEDGALLRLLRGLMKIETPEALKEPPISSPQYCWCGWG